MRRLRIAECGLRIGATAILAVALALALLAAPLADAQPAGKVYRVGILARSTAEASAPDVSAFRERLAEFGYVEG